MLDKKTGLTISDLIPLLPPTTKMKDLKDFLKQSITQQTSEIKLLQTKMAQQSKKMLELQPPKHTHKIFVDTEKNCGLCNSKLNLRDFYVYPCNHSLHRDCVVKLLVAKLEAHLLDDDFQ